MASNTLPSSGKIDIHHFVRRARVKQETLLQDPLISEKNKQLITQFLRDCELGKTIHQGQKKKIGKARIVKYLETLKQLAIWFNVDFDQVTQVQMEEFILGLENNQYTRRNGSPYTESVKRDYKVCLRKYYKWLLGDNETYPPIVRWLDTRDVIPEIPCLLRSEIERMSEHARNPMERAVIWVLFDSGARAEEFLNVRYRHLEETESEDKQTIYRIRIEFSKTKPRTLLLPVASPYLRRHIETQGQCGQDEQVFPLPYSRLRNIFRRVGMKGLGRRVHPHLLRHSSATYYAPLLSRAAFCYRYGWSYRSNMADRYIDREALNDQESVRAVTTRTTETVQRENTRLQEDMTALRDRLNQMDALMGLLTADPHIAQALAQKVRQMGEGEKLRNLHVQRERSNVVGLSD